MCIRDRKRNCAGIARRDFIQLGLGAAMGLGFTDLLRLRASAAAATGKVSPHQVNCIMIWLDGGPSHYETFDPKPDAPKEIRGELKPIPTAAAPTVDYIHPAGREAPHANSSRIG